MASLFCMYTETETKIMVVNNIKNRINGNKNYSC